ALGEPHRLEVVHTAAERSALEDVERETLLGPVVRHHAAADVRARGVRAKPAGVAAEALGVLVDPANGAAHLLDHGKEAAARIVDIGEVEDDEMRPGPHEWFGQASVVGGAVGAPGSAVDEDIDRRVRPAGA